MFILIHTTCPSVFPNLDFYLTKLLLLRLLYCTDWCLNCIIWHLYLYFQPLFHINSYIFIYIVNGNDMIIKGYYLLYGITALSLMTIFYLI